MFRIVSGAWQDAVSKYMHTPDNDPLQGSLESYCPVGTPSKKAAMTPRIETWRVRHLSLCDGGNVNVCASVCVSHYPDTVLAGDVPLEASGLCEIPESAIPI